MTLLAAGFGLGAGRPASETAVALQRAVDAAAEGGSVEIDAAQGPFDFGSSSFYLTNLTRTQVHGHGALLIFEPGHGVLVSQSRDVGIFGLSVDYDPPVNDPAFTEQKMQPSSLRSYACFWERGPCR